MSNRDHERVEPVNMRAMTEHERIEALFTYHPPTGDQPDRYQNIRDAAKLLAHTIMQNTPRCADQSAAVRKVREAVMTANAAIATNGIA